MIELKKLFYDPLRINAEERDILVWGCMHHGHDPKWPVPLWALRGYKSVTEHDATNILRWNSKATSETIGFLLGDTLFGDKGYERIVALLTQLEFRELYICSGNHQAGFKQLLDRATWAYDIEVNLPPKPSVSQFGVPYFKINSEKTVYLLPNYFEAFFNGHPVVLSHYPILSWNGQSKGSYHLFSHVHGSLTNSELGRLYLEKVRALEVSVEVNPLPLNYADIKRKLKDKAPFAPDHHTKENQNPF